MSKIKDYAEDEFGEAWEQDILEKIEKEAEVFEHAEASYKKTEEAKANGEYKRAKSPNYSGDLYETRTELRELQAKALGRDWF